MFLTTVGVEFEKKKITQTTKDESDKEIEVQRDNINVEEINIDGVSLRLNKADEHVVDRIFDQTIKVGKFSYDVRWDGYSADVNTG